MLTTKRSPSSRSVSYTHLDVYKRQDGKRDLDLSKEEDRKYALDWWLSEAIERFESADYQYIDFLGFYWLSEGASSAESEQHIMSFNDEVHNRGYKTYWTVSYTHLDVYKRQGS